MIGHQGGVGWSLATLVPAVLVDKGRIFVTTRNYSDFGAYPGTALRLLKDLYGTSRPRLAAAGLDFGEEFARAMRDLGVSTYDIEFDVRRTLGSSTEHILSYPHRTADLFDVAICTEVLEHQMYPLSLLVGINRFLRPGGTLYLTTNSACFLGDILKLAVGRHNVEPIAGSHVLTDHPWRPHIRLFTLQEVRYLAELSGFSVKEAYYFDNGIDECS